VLLTVNLNMRVKRCAAAVSKHKLKNCRFSQQQQKQPKLKAQFLMDITGTDTADISSMLWLRIRR